MISPLELFSLHSLGLVWRGQEDPDAGRHSVFVVDQVLVVGSVLVVDSILVVGSVLVVDSAFVVGFVLAVGSVSVVDSVFVVHSVLVVVRESHSPALGVDLDGLMKTAILC